jgi:hypothetical protein
MHSTNRHQLKRTIILISLVLLLSLAAGCSQTFEEDDKKITVGLLEFSIANNGTVTVDNVSGDVIFDTTIERNTGKPVTVTNTFSSDETVGATILLTNGGLYEPYGDKISSATITLNGEDIFMPSDFNQEVDYLERDITLISGENILEVTLQSQPGAKLTIQIIQ